MAERVDDAAIAAIDPIDKTHIIIPDGSGSTTPHLRSGKIPMISIYTISALRSGDYKVERSDVSAQLSPPLVLDRIATEDYFMDAKLVRGTLAEAWNDLARVGIVEFSVIEQGRFTSPE